MIENLKMIDKLGIKERRAQQKHKHRLFLLRSLRYAKKTG